MQSENKEKKKIRNFIKVNKPVGIAVTVLACLIVVGVSFTVYSKYYKTNYNKGMATASGFYFNSNYMASVAELRGMTPMTEEEMRDIDQDILNSVIISTNNGSWTEGVCTFNVQIRNYDNQLLYNDKDLNVKYQVNFMLLGAPEGARYSVARDDQRISLEWNDGQPNVVSFDGELAGGKLSIDSYQLEITPTSGSSSDDEYKSTDVLMVAYPTGPDFLEDTKVIAGILRANYEEGEFGLNGSKFLVCDKRDYQNASDDEKKAVILGESAYVFQLYTSGTFSGSGTATRKTIKVMWRKDMYKINDFDPYYQPIKEELKKDGVTSNDKYYEFNGDVEDKNGNVIKDKNGANPTWQVMEIDILPYSSLKFTFFRADTFEDVVNDPTFTVPHFESSVIVELADEDAGDSSGTP